MKAIPLIATSLDGLTTLFFKSIVMAEREGFSADCIGHCLKGRTKSHAGYSWMRDGKQEKPKPTKSLITVANYRNCGYPNKEIAKLMRISEQTVRVYAGRCIALGMCKSQAKGGNWND